MTTSPRLLLFLVGNTKLVEQERYSFDLARGDCRTWRAALELIERCLEPPYGVGWFPEEHGELDEEHSTDALSPDSLVHATSTLLELGRNAA